MEAKNKLIGAFYTPPKVIKFMQRFIQKENLQIDSILEPSMGDGRFVLEFDSLASEITAIDINEKEVAKFKNNHPKHSDNVICCDFLDFALETERRFDLVIGNPPYINKRNLSAEFINKAKSLSEANGFLASVTQNAWAAFIVAATSLLTDKGSIFFVLPYEFLQVHFAAKLRKKLEQRFNYIKIFSFNEALFNNIQQETCLVYMSNIVSDSPEITFERFKNVDDCKCEYRTSIKRNKPLAKWSNAVLSDEEIDVLVEGIPGIYRMKDLGSSAPGVVTAANRYFILSKNDCVRLKCEDVVSFIISKSSQLRGKIVIDEPLLKDLLGNGQKISMLNLFNTTEGELSDELREYLEKIGNTRRGGKKIREGYKCSRRNPWYAIPLVKAKPVCFFKRYDKIPRFVLNKVHCLTTDVAYGLELREEFDAASVVFSFYNSLTLAQCEYYGRFYGGGVSELTPSEFKSIGIPYKKVEETQFDMLEEMFEEGKSDDEIIEFVDSLVFDKKYADKIQSWRSIRKKLMARRIKE